MLLAQLSTTMRFPVLLCVLLVMGGRTSAQEAPARDFALVASLLRSGDTLRVWATRPALSRRRVLLDGIRGDTLRVIPSSGFIEMARFAAIPATSLSRIDRYVSTRVPRRPVRRGVAGMLIGGGFGALSLGLIGAALPDPSPRDDGGLVTLAGASIGLLVGGITGAVIGVRRDRQAAATWRTVFAR
jgi:hypothetical protein